MADANKSMLNYPACKDLNVFFLKCGIFLILQIKEDNTKIRRSPDKPIPENTEERRQDVSARTIYAVGRHFDN